MKGTSFKCLVVQQTQPAQHWWEASALTTAPSLHPVQYCLSVRSSRLLTVKFRYDGLVATDLFFRYGDLEQEALDLGITSELEVTVWFEKLCPFSIDDVTTIPFVQVCHYPPYAAVFFLTDTKYKNFCMLLKD